MKRPVWILIIVFGITLLISYTADARRKPTKRVSPELLAQVSGELAPEPTTDYMGGKIGIGYDDGISVRYWLTDGQSIQGIFKLKGELISGTTGEFELRIGGRFRPIVLARTERIILSVFAGLDIYKHTGIKNLFDSKEAYVYVCGGLSPEIFIFKNFSIETSLGMYVQLGGGTEPGEDPYTMFSIGTFGERLNLMAGVVFHVYFGL